MRRSIIVLGALAALTACQNDVKGCSGFTAQDRAMLTNARQSAEQARTDAAAAAAEAAQLRMQAVQSASEAQAIGSRAQEMFKASQGK